MNPKKLIFNFLSDAQDEELFNLKSLNSEKKVERLLKQFSEMNSYADRLKLFLRLESAIMDMKLELKEEFFNLGYLLKKSEIENNNE